VQGWQGWRVLRRDSIDRDDGVRCGRGGIASSKVDIVLVIPPELDIGPGSCNATPRGRNLTCRQLLRWLERGIQECVSRVRLDRCDVGESSPTNSGVTEGSWSKRRERQGVGETRRIVFNTNSGVPCGGDISSISIVSIGASS
jgi:hypothetical protein